MFPCGSSSPLSDDAEVFDVSPPSYICSAKTRSSKDKEEVLYHEIIDVDVEKDSESDDITLTHVIQKTSRKGKFGHMDTRGGRVEVSTFPWFPGNNTKVPEASSSILSTSKQGSKRPAAVVQINAGKKGKISSSEHKELYSAVGHKKKIQASQQDLFSHASTKLFSHPKNRWVNSLWSSNANYYPSGAMSANGGGYSTLKVPTTTPAGGDMFVPMLVPTFTPQEFPNDSVDDQEVKIQTSKNVDEVLQKYDNFKKFDIVDDFPDHLCRSKRPATATHILPGMGPMWARKIQEEWRILEKDLPDKIFVRVCESRMDLLRAVIIGAEGTPYHDGLYFFDVFFPSHYPFAPPHFRFYPGGTKLHPNISYGGKVCLSLLNTWPGGRMERWIPNFSTILQVLVSIQGLIFNAKPYFNEPGLRAMGGYVNCEKKSVEYNEQIFKYSLMTMAYCMRRPPKHFEEFVAGHFCKYGRDILVSCKAYLDGAQVGSCLVKGGIDDVDEGDRISSSKQFRAELPGYMNRLVKAFSQLGARDCDLNSILDGRSVSEK